MQSMQQSYLQALSSHPHAPRVVSVIHFTTIHPSHLPEEEAVSHRPLPSPSPSLFFCFSLSLTLFHSLSLSQPHPCLISLSASSLSHLSLSLILPVRCHMNDVHLG